jgi:lon-related putative ATP-dependent protease
MAATAIQELNVSLDELRKSYDSSEFDFERSDQLPPGKVHLGQQRAIDAMRFGVQMPSDGYNVFVLGPPGSHRHGLAEEIAKEQATKNKPPSDWCYVNNFSNPEQPRAIRFSAGTGAVFRDDMKGLIEELRLAIPAAFEGEDYRNQLKSIEAETQKEIEKQWKSLEARAAESGIGVMQTPTGYVLAPVRDGKVLGEKEFAKLPGAERERIESVTKILSEELQTRIERMPKLRKMHRQRVKELNREVTAHAVGMLLADLKEKYRDVAAAVVYLDDAERNIVENAQDFREPEHTPLPFLARDPSQLFGQYEVNLVVSHEPDATGPIVYEPNPSYYNIIGKIEHRAELGALLTDFRMIRSGALLQANDGFLILDIQRVLSRPFVWEALKQALFAKCVRIESPGETYGLVSTTTLRPESIPLDVKIILVGERWLYYLLCAYDSEFRDLFKVAADLDDDLERSTENVRAYASLIADRIRDLKLVPFSKDAVQRVIEQRARVAEDSERLSMHMGSLNDLLKQADHWARSRDAEVVELPDVAHAIEQARRRLNRVQTKIVDAIKRDTLLIDTEGECVGQVNGLSVVSLGDYRFGHPVRITATTRMGSGEVVDIEREAKLGGSIHSKGVMILSSALSARYAADVPLSLHGSLVFEQSYGGVEGDSASVAELCALLSSVSGVPIRQCLAVTGSVNQLGRVQAVGGINEKIEGYFDVAKIRGLDGSHGVVIPRDNVKHLMLRDEVVEAVRDGLFTVYAVHDTDEALTLLTGLEAGKRDDNGAFPKGSVNLKVERQLIRYAQLRKQFGEQAKGDEGD